MVGFGDILGGLQSMARTATMYDPNTRDAFFENERNKIAQQQLQIQRDRMMEESQNQNLRKMAEQAAMKDAMGIPLTQEDYASVNAFNRFQAPRFDPLTGTMMQPLNVQLGGKPAELPSSFGALGSNPMQQTPTAVPPSVPPMRGGFGGIATNQPVQPYDTPESQAQLAQANAAQAQVQTGGVPSELPATTVADASVLFGEQPAPQTPSQPDSKAAMYDKRIAQLDAVAQDRIKELNQIPNQLSQITDLRQKSALDAKKTAIEAELKRIETAQNRLISERDKIMGRELEKPTEGAISANTFANRMLQQGNNLNAIESIPNFSPTNLSDITMEVVKDAGLGVANLGISPEKQQYLQSASDWIRAKLRKESGAAIGDKEMEKEYTTYFPVFGDKPAIIEQKRKARELATKAMIKEAGKAFAPMEDMIRNGQPAAQPASQSSTSQQQVDWRTYFGGQ